MWHLNVPATCSQVRKDGTVPWLRPDGKTQVTVEYVKEDGAMVPIRVHTILISTQHSPDVTNDQIHKDLQVQLCLGYILQKSTDKCQLLCLCSICTCVGSKRFLSCCEV